MSPPVRRPSRGSGSSQPTRSGRHPSADAVEVRLITPAFDDIKTLSRTNPQATKWALKKLVHIGRDPEAGEPLHGDLIGWRKLTVGNRDWRVIWRVTYDDSGRPIVDVAEMWALGARSDDEVYAEMSDRVKSLPPNPSTMALEEVVSKLGNLAAGLGMEEMTPGQEPLPDWLRERLTQKLHLSVDQVDEMTFDEALARWEEFMTSPR